jgi:hypothetical protein
MPFNKIGIGRSDNCFNGIDFKKWKNNECKKYEQDICNNIYFNDRAGQFFFINTLRFSEHPIIHFGPQRKK